MSGSSNDVPGPPPDAHPDATGLVAIIVVFVLLLLGSAAAYLLMRLHFAKARGKVIAADAVGKERDGEQGLGKSEISTMVGEKVRALEISGREVGDEERRICADAESALGRRRSVAGGGGGGSGGLVHTRF
ncbi:hypothetical protein F5Y12DRAFT_50783 [Xylaria sp. FL1777]|nr:hypothetical protein F5Y12DRAFT_50783 [Xylaria sp. FL1777]